MKEEDFPRLLQGRMFTLEVLETVRRLIAENPAAKRQNLARMLCQLWEWYSPGGALKMMSAKQLEPRDRFIGWNEQQRRLNAIPGLLVCTFMKTTG
jgi:hypothetical protein